MRIIGASDGYEQRYAYIYDIYQTNIYEIFIYIFNIYVWYIYEIYIYLISPAIPYCCVLVLFACVKARVVGGGGGGGERGA